MDVRVGLFRGAEVNVESLKSLVIGGIAFATPENASTGPVADGLPFILHDQAEKDWLEWAPRISLPPDGVSVEPGEREAARSVDFATPSLR
jgi:paraquat-inducible protein B